MSFDKRDILNIYNKLGLTSSITDDGLIFMETCICNIECKILNTNITTFVINNLTGFLRENISKMLDAYKLYHVTNIITKDIFLELMTCYILDDSFKHRRYKPKFITSYDIITMICYDDDLYTLLEDSIPYFHYFDINLYQECVEKSFGTISSTNFHFYLENYLRGKLSYIQNYKYSDIRTYVSNLTGTNYIAPLNIYGAYITYIATHIKKILEKSYGNDTSNYTFLNLLDSIYKFDTLTKNIIN